MYQNPVPTVVNTSGMLPRILAKALTTRAERVPRKTMGPFKTEAVIYQEPPSDGLRITWLGHSTVLLEIDGWTILIDPVWSRRLSPVSWFGPKRFYPPPLSLAELPPIDLVLLSHDHYDHLDAGTIRHLAGRVALFVCSRGLGAYLQRWGVPAAQLRELDWMEDFVPDPPHTSASRTPLTITALPARHFSGRTTKRNCTLWSSFVLRTPRHSVYFGADSGYYPGFEELGAAYGPFDLTMLEIGASDPLWPQIHLGPDGAMQAHLDLSGSGGGGLGAGRGPGLLLPIHWGLFNLAFHAWYEPVERLVTLAGEASIPLLLPAPGVPTEVTRAPGTLPYWWLPYKS